MRTRQGLPFVCTKYMKMLLESVMARVQRDEKVTLCHHLWMANHPHIIIVAKDKAAATRFYGEIQKQLTEVIKRLLGLPHLSLWKRNATSVIPYHDIDTICYRIAYLYANPARAHLVDSIDQYNGTSSWVQFCLGKTELLSAHSEEHPWVQASRIGELPRSALSRREDLDICKEWEKSATEAHSLIVRPNAWMRAFKVESASEVKKHNKEILRYLIAFEQEARVQRQKKKQKPMGPNKLAAQGINLSYRSKKKSRRICAYSLDPEFRVYLIEQYEWFCEQCRRCYERWKLGDYSVVWPAGAFLPPMPHIQNTLII